MSLYYANHHRTSQRCPCGFMASSQAATYTWCFVGKYIMVVAVSNYRLVCVFLPASLFVHLLQCTTEFDPFHNHVKWLFGWCEYNCAPVDARRTVHRRRKFTFFDGSVFLRTWNYRSLHCPLVYFVCCLAGNTRHDSLCYLSVVTQVICCVFRRHCFICKAFKMTIP